MANVLLGVTGSVAAIKTPELFYGLQKRHQVRVVATTPALYFFDPAALTGSRRDPAVVSLDEDEWPGRTTRPAPGRVAGQIWQRNEEILHIELRRWADLFLIAPLDANTLAKLAWGLCDNCLTCVWRAWDQTRPLLLAPAMNTLMWEHPATARCFRLLATDHAVAEPPTGLSLMNLFDWLRIHGRGLHVAPPVTKQLACLDEGIGAMAAVADLLAWVDQLLPS